MAWVSSVSGPHPRWTVDQEPWRRTQILDPMNPGSWNSQKLMWVGGPHFSLLHPQPNITKFPGISSASLSHLTIASFLLVGENKQQKVKILVRASVNENRVSCLPFIFCPEK